MFLFLFDSSMKICFLFWALLDVWRVQRNTILKFGCFFGGKNQDGTPRLLSGWTSKFWVRKNTCWSRKTLSTAMALLYGSYFGLCLFYQDYSLHLILVQKKKELKLYRSELGTEIWQPSWILCRYPQAQCLLLVGLLLFVFRHIVQIWAKHWLVRIPITLSCYTRQTSSWAHFEAQKMHNHINAQNISPFLSS